MLNPKPFYKPAFEKIRRFQRNRSAMAGFYIIVLMFTIAFLGALIRPDKSPFANEQMISIARLPPFSEVQFLKVRKNKVIAERKWWELFLQGGQENKYVLVPAASVEVQDQRLKVKIWSVLDVEEYRFYHLADVLYAVDDKVIVTQARDTSGYREFTDLYGNRIRTTDTQMAGEILKKSIIRRFFVLGTDQYGRDLMSRLMAGSFASLSVGLASVVIALVIGLVVGLIAGYFGGLADRFLSWVMNVFWSVPAILLVISITLVLGKGIFALLFGIGLILWVEMAQVVRGEVRSVRKREYIKAARLMGLGHGRILLVHVLPNVMGPVTVLSASNFAEAILLEAGLNFLGVGIQLPKPTWGGMIRETYGFIITDGAYLALVPGLAIIILVLAFVFVSNGLRDAFDIGRQPLDISRA